MRSADEDPLARLQRMAALSASAAGIWTLPSLEPQVLRVSGRAEPCVEASIFPSISLSWRIFFSAVFGTDAETCVEPRGPCGGSSRERALCGALLARAKTPTEPPSFV